MDFLHDILWFLIGYDNSLFDNRFVQHIIGGYMLTHLSSLILRKYFWLIAIFVGIGKELIDHFIFGCGNNEIKHFYDILAWSVGGIFCYLILQIIKKKKTTKK